MNDTNEKDDNRPEQEETIPTANLGAGAVGPGSKIGRYKLLSVLGERPVRVIWWLGTSPGSLA